MAVDFCIRDGTGTKSKANVSSDNALKVYTTDITLADQAVSNYAELIRKKQYRDWLRTSTGDTDMCIDGSSTPVYFLETPQSDRVKWVMSWRIILHSTDMEINTNDFRRFGAAAIAPGLTNGIEFYFNQAGRRTDVFLENVKSIGQFLDYADGFTNLVNAVTSQSDYLSLDFSFDQPVVLAPGSNDQIVLGVSDDLTALDFAQVIVRGWQEFL